MDTDQLWRDFTVPPSNEGYTDHDTDNRSCIWIHPPHPLPSATTLQSMHIDLSWEMVHSHIKSRAGLSWWCCYLSFWLTGDKISWQYDAADEVLIWWYLLFCCIMTLSTIQCDNTGSYVCILCTIDSTNSIARTTTLKSIGTTDMNIQ